MEKKRKREEVSAVEAIIDPNLLYTLRAFEARSGISATRIHLAARDGVELPTIEVGRRKFIPGVRAIDYIKKLGELHQRQKKDRLEQER